MHTLEIVKYLQQRKIPPLKKLPEPLINFTAACASLRGRIQSLSNLERVLATIQHKEPDRVPVTPLVCAGGRQISGIGYPDFALDADKAAGAFLDGFDFIGGDLVILLLDLSVEAADFGQHMVYPDGSTPHPDYNRPIIPSVDDYSKIKPIELREAKRMQEFVRLCKIMTEKIGLRGIVTGFVFGPLGVLSMMRGAENLFKDCMTHPKKVMAACETITEVLIDFVRAQGETGVPAVAIDTLFASANGLSKPMWEEIEGPFAREISMAIKEQGLIVGVHNCGHDLYFDAQIRSMEPDVISFAHLPDDCNTRKELKERYGDQVTLLGHVPTPLLVHGSPKDVMEECKKQIDDLAPGGGYVLAPGCEYPPNIPLTNAFAMVNAAKTYG